MLLELPLELVVMIIKLLFFRGGNVTALRTVCRCLRAIVQSMIKERVRELDDTLFMLNEWQRMMPGKLAVHGPICFYLKSGRRQPMVPMRIEVTYLGSHRDRVPHPTEFGKFAPSWDEMTPTEDRHVRAVKIGSIQFNRYDVHVSLKGLLRLVQCSYYNFGYTNPGMIVYSPWYGDWTYFQEFDPLNTLYCNKDLYDEAEIRRDCRVLLMSKFKFSLI